MKRGAWLAICFGIAVLAGAPALGQGLSEIGKSDEPLEINADEGIEWHRDIKTYVARGNARAASGDLEVFADVLTAHYREGQDQSSEIYLLDLEGNVRIVSSNETVYGDRGQYILDEQRMELHGNGLKMESHDKVDVITARDSLEYWEAKQVAVARGNAIARHEDKEVRADLLVAYLKPDQNEQLEVRQVVATGNVRIRTPTDYAVGESGVYYVKEEVATLTGGVKITREENQMNGEYAEVNMKTGISKLTGGPPGQEGKGRVQGLILPRAKPKQ